MRQLSIVALFYLGFLSPIHTLAQPNVAKNEIKDIDRTEFNTGRTFSKDKASLVISFIKLKLLVNNDDF